MKFNIEFELTEDEANVYIQDYNGDNIRDTVTQYVTKQMEEILKKNNLYDDDYNQWADKYSAVRDR